MRSATPARVGLGWVGLGACDGRAGYFFGGRLQAPRGGLSIDEPRIIAECTLNGGGFQECCVSLGTGKPRRGALS